MCSPNGFLVNSQPEMRAFLGLTESIEQNLCQKGWNLKTIGFQ
jgi:hypothetical protein